MNEGSDTPGAIPAHEPPPPGFSYAPSAPPDPRSMQPVAPAWHTAVVLAYLAAFTWLSASSVSDHGLPPGMSRVYVYVPILFFQWILFGFCWWGLRLRGVSVRGILANRWRGAAGLVRTLLIAAGFWVAAFLLLANGMHAIGLQEPERIRAIAALLLPRAPLEYAAWVLVAITAGVVEEVVFRGYLQRQFTAWCRNHAAGIVLSALAFGAGHLYQGLGSATVITAIGLSFGILAYATRSLVPGVFAHAWADLFPAVIGKI